MQNKYYIKISQTCAHTSQFPIVLFFFTPDFTPETKIQKYFNDAYSFYAWRFLNPSYMDNHSVTNEAPKFFVFNSIMRIVRGKCK